MKNFIFVHIPKAAGQTLTHILWQIYGKSKVWSAQRPKMGKFDPKKHMVAKGHFGINHLEINWPKVTMLRDPVERVISHYFFAKYNKSGVFGSRGVKKKASLEKFARAKKNINVIKSYTGPQIEKFDLILLTEHFDESVDRLLKWIGYKGPPIKYGKINKTKKKDIVTPKQREIITELNQEDIELYNRAKKLFGKG